jgi:hypothetical protein
MVHIITGYKYRLAIWFHRYIRTRQVSQDMDNFVFQILLKQQQNSLKTNKTTGVRSKKSNDWTRR